MADQTALENGERRQGESLCLCRFDVVTLFPEMFSALTDYGITGRALCRHLAEIEWVNPRDFTQNGYRSVDDRPYGGGPGMVMMTEPLSLAVEAAKKARKQAGWSASPVIYMSPQGETLSEPWVKRIRATKGAIILAGRYEGVDQRFIDRYVDIELSIGDYVLSGGELPAMVVMDSVIRQLPEALGDGQSAVEESFVDGLLDHPHFTRASIDSEKGRGTAEKETVPSVLLSGHHADIETWRLQQRLGKTWLRRPDLLEKRFLSPKEKTLLAEFQQQLKARYEAVMRDSSGERS